MIKEATYKEKFNLLKGVLPSIFEEVKKDLRQDHLKADMAFYKKHFNNKMPNKIEVSEFVAAYSQEITQEGNEQLGEFVASRWLMVGLNGSVTSLMAARSKKSMPYCALKLTTPKKSRSASK